MRAHWTSMFGTVIITTNETTMDRNEDDEQYPSDTKYDILGH